MTFDVLLPALTSVLALIFALALLDQWLERRGTFQLVWAIGMLFYGVAAGAEALAQAFGWSEPLYRTWYLVGGVWLVGWLGLGTAFLLARTRFGYGFALCIFFAGLFTFLTPRRAPTEYADAGSLPRSTSSSPSSWRSRSQSRPTSRTSAGRRWLAPPSWASRSARSC